MKIGKGMKMRTTSLISCIVFLTIAGHALADVDWCDVEIVPQYPTSQDAVVITLSGWWPDTCIPNDSGVSLAGNDIYFDVIRTYPPGIICLFMPTPWERTESAGPLSPGTYTVYARMVDYYYGVTDYEWVAEFNVSDYQFVLSADSIIVPEDATATFTVSLLMQPSGTVEATIAHQSGDTDITVRSGASLIFESYNYWIPQTVTLAADEDEDYLDGTAIITVSAPNYLSREITATEADNDDRYVIYVDADAPGANIGTSWLHAYTDLQDALRDAAAYPDIGEIRVAQGTYTPAEPNGSRTATFQLINGLAVKGGYAGFGEPDPDTRSVNAYKTILSGDLDGNDIGDLNDPSRNDNCHKVVTGDHVNKTAVLDGFIVTAGNGDKGAGIYISGSSGPVISNCIISGNRASIWGGGMYNRASTEIVNCILIANSANLGGGIYSYSASQKMINCTFSSNSADGSGGGLYVRGDGGNPELTNCILWANTDSGGQDESAQAHINYTYESTTTFNYCCIKGWSGSMEGMNNIDTDPCFADPGNGDYHLKSQAGRWDPNSQSWVKDNVTSPCIDAGYPGSDWTAELWPHGMRINMGAYGGTPEASMSLSDVGNIADLNGDGSVNHEDYIRYIGKWLYEGVLLSEDLDRSGFVNFIDFAIFGGQWQIGPGPAIAYDIGGCIPVDFPSSAVVEFEPTRFTVTVEGQYVLFEDMMRANCCPEELDVQMTVEDDLITIYEIEYTPMPCPCLCDFPITATLGPFEPGNYILEVYQGAGFIGATTVTISSEQ